MVWGMFMTIFLFIYLSIRTITIDTSTSSGMPYVALTTIHNIEAPYFSLSIRSHAQRYSYNDTSAHQTDPTG